MDNNQFSIPIFTNTFIDFRQPCWFKITKKGDNFEGFRIQSNVTGNSTVDLFKEVTHGKFEHIQSDHVTLNYNQSMYILVKSSQWYQGKVDMLRLEAYSETAPKLKYGYIILIVAGGILLLVAITLLIIFLIRKKKKGVPSVAFRYLHICFTACIVTNNQRKRKTVRLFY